MAQINNVAARSPKTGHKNFCSNCGARLYDHAKFCHICGIPVEITPVAPAPAPAPTPTPTPTPTPKDKPTHKKGKARKGFSKERKEEYVGRVLKCSNCGATITESTAVCPECGFHITGKVAVNSVQDFKNQLMELESHRSRSFIFNNTTMVDPVDKQKITLIKNYPIPNSVDDIMEFMLLAMANIDVRLSKRKWDKYPTVESGYTIRRSISNSWVSKMMQAYQKAELIFPDDPAFAKIQKLYFDKAKELKIIK